jgi:hypothetical protein
MNRQSFKELFTKKEDGLPDKECLCFVIENNEMPPRLRNHTPHRAHLYGYWQEVTHCMIFDTLPTLKQLDILDYARALSKTKDCLKLVDELTFESKNNEHLK